VEYPGEFARQRAAELRETAAGFSQPLPFYGISEQTLADGYSSLADRSCVAHCWRRAVLRFYAELC
jgi:hypothetical protein